MSFFLKDPQARVDYAIDWAVYLDDQSIEASVWVITPEEAGGVVAEEASFEPARTAARLAGGLTSIGVIGNADVGGTSRVDGVKVVGNRVTGWSAATGTASRASFDAGSVTVAQLAQRLKALLDDLISHGLIGSS
jgi:hypothetical protein